jgi:hypothetical protein
MDLLRSDLESILNEIRVMEAFNAEVTRLTGLGTPPDLEAQRVIMLGLVGNNPGSTAGIRTTSGVLNNLTPGNAAFGSADQPFISLTNPTYVSGNAGAGFDPDGPTGPAGLITNADYTPNAAAGNNVVDSQPRQISQLISDQSTANPAAIAASARSGGGIVMYTGDMAASTDLGGGIFRGTTGSLHNAAGEVVDEVGNPMLTVLNNAPDGVSAPYNSWLTLFGQGFDHGLDHITKGGNGKVYIPLLPTDPLYDHTPGARTNFMVVTRASLNAVNSTTPWIDMNQAYGSSPSFQVFLREYRLEGGRPVATGKLLGGVNGGLPSWGEIKLQAAQMLGIALTDEWVGDSPQIVTDQFGRFIPDANGMPQVEFATATPGVFEYRSGTAAAPLNLGVPGAAGAAEVTGHAFLLDIAHTAAPGAGKTADLDNIAGNPQTVVRGQATTYDDELLAAHFIAGDGRVNENSGLTSFHTIFHNEHDRLVADYKRIALESGDVAFLNEWLNTPVTILPGVADAANLDWNGERLFQAARFMVEMQYQHGVFEEFSRFIQPNLNLFGGVNTDLDPSIFREFAHAVYRFGHSMLNETVDRVTLDPISGTWTDNSTSLIQAFLNPLGFLRENGVTGIAELTPEQAAGEVLRGMTRQQGNAIDEFVTGALHNNLVGLPLDLGAVNIARARELGMPRFNQVREELYTATLDSRLSPYGSWAEFAAGIKHPESIINFVAAYGTHITITLQATDAGKRAAASALINGSEVSFLDENGVVQTLPVPADSVDFLNATGAWALPAANKGGLDLVDFWIGGLAEKGLAANDMLGSTFAYVFETQIENLQNADRHYYLARLNGNLLAQIEQNTFAGMAERNVAVDHLPGHIFTTPTWTLEVDQRFQHTGLEATINRSTGLQDTSAGGKADPIGRVGLLNLVSRSATGNLPGIAATNRLFYNGEDHVVLGGTDQNDLLSAGNGDDTIYGDGGNDRIYTGGGDDLAFGGAGDDIIFDGGAGAAGDVIRGEDGHDVVSLSAGLAIVFGGNGNDFVIGGASAAEVFANAGNDFVLLGRGGGAAMGGVGDDWLEGGGGADGVIGEDGRGLVVDINTGLPAPAGRGQELGDDVIVLGDGDDRGEGELGNDIFIDGAGDDVYAGDDGFDWVVFGRDVSPREINLGAVAPIAPPANLIIGDTFDLNTEAVSGTRQNDTILGDSRTDLQPTLAGVAINPLDNRLTQDKFAQIGGLFSTNVALDGALINNTLLARNDLFTGAAGARALSFGNILLGGGGADSIQGNGGNDIIDGDLELTVQIEWRRTGFAPQRFDSMTQLQEAATNAIVNPGDLHIVRELRSSADQNQGDEAVFRGAFREYDIEGITWSGGQGFLNLVQNNTVRTGTTGLRGTARDVDGDGYIRVSHNANFVTGGALGATFDGVDYVRNVESLRFLNITGALATDGADQVLSAALGFTGTGNANAGAGTTPGGTTTVRMTPTQSTLASGFNPDTAPLAVGGEERVLPVQVGAQGGVGNTFSVVETVGSFGLDTDQAGGIWIRNTATVARIKLTYQGQQVTATQFPGWSFAGVRAVTGGFEVALNNADGSFGTWQVNTLGAYVSGQNLNTAQIVDKEVAFGQDLNVDTQIGTVLAAAASVGMTSLTTDQLGRLWLRDGVSADLRITFQGNQVTATQFPGWSFAAARSLGAGAGFELALKNADGTYGTWTVDAAGAWVSSQSLTEAQIVDKEAAFGQDLNGDFQIGAVTTMTFTAPTADGPGLGMDNVGRYRISEAGSDVTLKYNGAEVQASSYPDWTAMAIAPMGGSPDNTVLWRHSAGGYGIWQVDANGNHQSSKMLSSLEVASMESTFGIDLNANGFIGAYLGQNAGGYLLGPDVTLKLNGAQVGANSFANWSAIAAAATAEGNQVAWGTNTGMFGIWSTDAQGNYQTGRTVNNVQIGAYENLFAEDLNGNGILDTLRTVEAFGTTSVAVDLNGGYSLSSARGVQLLQFNGQQVTENFGGGWNVVGAEDTVTGFQVVFKNATSGASAYWNTDANGNYLAVKVMDGVQLKAFETSFQQDLDNSGTVDPLTQVETAGSASLLQQANGGYVIDGANGIQFLNFQGTQVTPGFAPGWTLNGVEGQGSGYAANWTAPGGAQQYNWFTNSTGDYLSAGLA